MSLFLQDLYEMSGKERANYINNKSETIAKSIIFDINTYEGGDSLSKKIYPFLNRETKKLTFEIFNSKFLNKDNNNQLRITSCANFYRLFKTETFSEDLLTKIYNKTMALNKDDFNDHKGLLGLFYASSLFHNGNPIFGQSLLIKDDFINKVKEKDACSILSYITSCAPYSKNLQKLRALGIKFSLQDEISNLNTLLRTSEDDVFIKDMVIENLSGALVGENNLMNKWVDQEYHDDIIAHQKRFFNKVR